MTSPNSVITLNLLPPQKIFCDFTYWSALFSQDMQILWERGHGIPLNKLPAEVADMVFPYLLLALSEYKISNKRKISGVGLDNLLNLWFDKYLLNKNGYFELMHLNIS